MSDGCWELPISVTDLTQWDFHRTLMDRGIESHTGHGVAAHEHQTTGR